MGGGVSAKLKTLNRHADKQPCFGTQVGLDLLNKR